MLNEPFEPLTSEERAEQSFNQKCEKDIGEAIIPVPDNVPLDIPKHYQLGVPAFFWDYRDPNGRLIMRNCRFIDAAGEKQDRPLTYRQFKSGGRRWSWASVDTPRPLYGLDRLAKRPDAPVILCEGEKSTDAATQIFPDYVAVTSPNGAKSAGLADWGPLSGRKVIIWPDHDYEGLDYAHDAAQFILKAGAVSVAIVNVPDHFPEKWDVADKLPPKITCNNLLQLINEASPFQLPLQSQQPKNFECRKDGVYKLKIKEDDSDDDAPPKWIKICGPLEVLAATSNDDSEEWGRLVKVTNRDGVEHIRAISMELFASPDGKDLRSFLFNLGLELESPDKFTRDALYEYLCKASSTQRALCVPRIGWHDDVFVLPDQTIGKTNKLVVLQTASGYDNNYKVHGTIEGWKSQIAQYGVGNSRLAFALSTAFAAPLVGLVKAESGGIHFRGQSSIGKSSILHAAGSVWGGNRNSSLGYLQQWRATDNGLEGVCSAHSDSLLCLDELSQVDPKAAGNTAYMIANGAGKSRAKKTGEWRKPPTWRILFLSNGEISLSDKIAEDGSGRKLAAGQHVRVIDLAADPGAGLGLYETLHDFESPAALSDHLKSAAKNHYGHAARLFLNLITEDLEKTISAVNGYINEFVKKNCPPGADGQIHRMAQRFGLIAAGGELATAQGVLPWAPGEATKAALICFRSTLESRGGTEPAEVRDVLSQVRKFVELHGESRFSKWTTELPLDDRPIINRVGFKRYIKNDVHYYFTPEAWRQEVCKGFDLGFVNKTLADKKILLPRPDGKLQRTERLPGYEKPTSCYVISQTALFEGGGKNHDSISEF